MAPAEYVFSAAGAEAFAVLLHATSAANKEWPEENWVQIGAELTARNLRSVLPYGNTNERRRSERLAARIRGAQGDAGQAHGWTTC